MEEFDSVKRWVNGFQTDHSGSPHTRTLYMKVLKDFSEWTGKTPDQLIQERKEQLKSEDMTVKRKAEETLRQFSSYLEHEKGLRRGTVRTYFAVVVSFYKYNYVPLMLKAPRKTVPQGVQAHTREEIKSLLDVADTREKAVILCLAESGMSREDFVKLNYDHIKEDYEAQKETIALKVVRSKAQVPHHTFFGITGTQALRAYLELRKRKGEVFTDTTPLWKSEKGGKQFKYPNSLTLLLRRLGKKAGVTTSPHRFRKFFESNLGTVVPSLLVKYWVGHTLGVESSYFVPSVEEQRKAYLEAYEKIDILGTTKKVSEESMEDQLRILSMLMRGKTETEKQEMWRDYMQRLPPELRPTFEKVAKTKSKSYGIDVSFNGKDKKNSQDCQKIITEEELPEYLQKGYRFVSVLPSGKVVVED